jgi:predicted transport protein
MATKNVLFIGYNLEDINIESLFRKISETLNLHAKEAFLISPNLPQVKSVALIQKGINYIDSTAEIFFEKLHENIKQNIIEDFEKGKVGSDVFRRVLKQNNLNPTLKAFEDKFIIGDVNHTNDTPTGGVKFTIDANNKEVLQKLKEFISRENFSDVELDSNSLLSSEMILNGIKFPGNAGDKVVLKAIPFINDSVDFLFGEEKEYSDVPVEVFRGKGFVDVLILLKTIKLQIRLKLDELVDPSNLSFKLTISREGGYKKINHEIDTYSFLNDLASCSKVTIFNSNFGTMSYGMLKSELLGKEAEKHLFYFNALKKIERYFNVRFGEIGDIRQDDYDRLLNMVALAEDDEILGVSKDGFFYQATDLESTLKFIEYFNNIENRDLCTISNESETLELHNILLNLGYRTTQLLEPYIANEKELRSGSTDKINIKSKTGTLRVTFGTKPESMDDVKSI